jgi:effector-binding domain-containing protein
MLDEPQIIQTKSLPIAAIRFTIPREEIRHVMGPAMAEVRAAVRSQHIGPAGPMLSYHLKMSPEIFDFEVGVPISSALLPVGRVIGSELPASKVARTIYHGPYEELGEAWSEFMDWIIAQGLKPADALWECYTNGPESSSDSSTWCTELNKPLLD